MSEELRFWIALQRVHGVGPVRYRALLDRFSTPRAIFDQVDQLTTAGFEPKIADAIRALDWSLVDQDCEWLQKEHRHVITLADPRFPPMLREIHQGPALLYVVGDASCLQSPQLAIVGSRNPSASGSRTAFDFARDLAANGLTITSGLALGIDGESHKGALASAGKTIAVMGTGCDRIYPARHQQLAHQIVDSGGALVSELPLGTPPNKENFPRRNRIISGMSLGTLVVEAARESGSLITAKYAVEQSREVFAIPGSIHNPLARGCHDLIRQGAKLVETTQDILEELRIPSAIFDDANSQYSNDEFSQTTLDQEYELVLNLLGFEPTAIDTVVARSGLTPEAVSSMLLVLELQDYVKLQAGGHYSRIK